MLKPIPPCPRNTRGPLERWRSICVRGVRLSLYLAIFNLLPVPPLDGSKLLLAAKVPYFIYAELSTDS